MMVSPEIKAQSQEFHFPGGLEFKPTTIVANSREEAEKIWLKQRIKVGSEKIRKEQNHE